MFVLRGIAVSFSVFAIVYCALSVVVAFLWRRIRACFQRYPVRQIADLLFVLRLFPLVTAALITATFTVPSFLLLEPRAIDEPIGGILLVCALFGIALGAFGIVNAKLALRRAAQAVSTWMNDAQPVAGTPVPVLRISGNFPAMTATGIVRPKVLLSSSAEFVLNAGELQTALNHEIAHVRRRDNLRKLALCCVVFPGMRGLEAAWLEATEMAADDAAVSNADEALDLAAALIKLSRITAAVPSVELTAALVHSPVSAMNARVERLIRWKAGQVPGYRYSLWGGLAVTTAIAALYAITYSQMLLQMHTATEWLVR
jgi:beta-lactamase regulating signal transducer with metallopeptidase domain